MLGSVGTSRRSVKQTIDYSKTGHPFLRTRLICSLDGINFEAFEVPFDIGTRGTNVPRFKPKTHGPVTGISLMRTVVWSVPL